MLRSFHIVKRFAELFLNPSASWHGVLCLLTPPCALLTISFKLANIVFAKRSIKSTCWFTRELFHAFCVLCSLPALHRCSPASQVCGHAHQLVRAFQPQEAEGKLVTSKILYKSRPACVFPPRHLLLWKLDLFVKLRVVSSTEHHCYITFLMMCWLRQQTLVFHFIWSCIMAYSMTCSVYLNAWSAFKNCYLIFV